MKEDVKNFIRESIELEFPLDSSDTGDKKDCYKNKITQRMNFYKEEVERYQKQVIRYSQLLTACEEVF